MKRFLMVFLVVMVLATVGVALAEAVDAVPVESTSEEAPVPFLADVTEFFDLKMIGTFAGAMAVTAVLVEVVKRLANLSTNAVRVTTMVAALVVVGAGRFLGGSPIDAENIILAIFNAALVAFSTMKAYELSFGAPLTPAGFVHYK